MDVDFVVTHGLHGRLSAGLAAEALAEDTALDRHVVRFRWKEETVLHCRTVCGAVLSFATSRHVHRRRERSSIPLSFHSATCLNSNQGS